MQRISKRLEALERAAEKKVFADALPFAVAYYLGGAKDESEMVDAYARALGYQDHEGLCQGLADLLCQASDSVDQPSGIRMRTYRAQRKLFTKFGYNLRGASPAAVADAAYRIVRTLHEEWRAMINSAHRESCEAEVRANQFLKEAMKLAEEC
jgi:predicted ATPase